MILSNFTNRFPGEKIYFEGSTPSRTRRYQMIINKYWSKLDPLFTIFGYIEDKGFEKFRAGVNYEAFLAVRKKDNVLTIK